MADAKMIARCVCGNVEIEAVGTPIGAVACHCDDCQAGSRQLEALPGAVPILDAGAGTEYVLYSKDRLRYLKGAELTEHHRLKPEAATSRVVASCCGSAMQVSFDDLRHWSPVYRARFGAAAPPIEMRICTRFMPAGVSLPDDVPSSPGYPLTFMRRLLTSGIASMLRL